MRLIILSSSHCELREHLEKRIQDKLPGIEVEQVDSILDLSKKLTRPLNRISILVSFVDDSNDISNLISLRPLLDNTKQIRIPPMISFDFNVIFFIFISSGYVNLCPSKIIFVSDKFFWWLRKHSSGHCYCNWYMMAPAVIRIPSSPEPCPV